MMDDVIAITSCLVYSMM